MGFLRIKRTAHGPRYFLFLLHATWRTMEHNKSMLSVFFWLSEQIPSETRSTEILWKNKRTTREGGLAPRPPSTAHNGFYEFCVPGNTVWIFFTRGFLTSPLNIPSKGSNGKIWQLDFPPLCFLLQWAVIPHRKSESTLNCAETSVTLKRHRTVCRYAVISFWCKLDSLAPHWPKPCGAWKFPSRCMLPIQTGLISSFVSWNRPLDCRRTILSIIVIFSPCWTNDLWNIIGRTMTN